MNVDAAEPRNLEHVFRKDHPVRDHRDHVGLESAQRLGLRA
jgi:hypothetical protein